MYIQQLYTNCLAEAAYYIESNGEAAIIDPLRETEPYMALAASRNARIKYVFETHFHADFVSGHIDLAAKTGAKIIYGPTAQAGYAIYTSKDEEVFPLGTISLVVLHTPGHTLESACFLLKDEQGKNHCVFTGDTLFNGDVGRPDLAVKSDLSSRDLAGMLYDSIQTKLIPLADDVIVYPGHGAGSACGKNISKETVTTIGEQKKINYALCCATRQEFVDAVSNGLDAPPKYFFIDAGINRNGYASIDEVMKNNAIALDIAAFQTYQSECIILDTRDPDTFEKGYIPSSLNIGLNGQYAVWVGSLIDFKSPLLLVCDLGKEEEAVLRLARVGFENVKGYLSGGIETWKNAQLPIEIMNSVEPESILQVGKEEERILDVRNPSEWKQGILENAITLSLSELEQNVSTLNKSAHYFVHCAGGYRSMMAASILKRNGFQHVTNVRGGFNKIKACGAMIVDFESASAAM